MNSDCIVLIASESRGRSALQRILSTTALTVEVRSEERVLADGGIASARLAVLHYDQTKPQSTAVLAALSRDPRCPLVVTLPAAHKADLVELFSHAAVTNIIPETSDFLSNELIVTVQKILRNDIFGFEKYITWGMPRHDYLVRSTRQHHAVMAELGRYLHTLGVNTRLLAQATGVADELLMNAIYSAPVDPAGQPKYAALARNHDLQLPAEEAVGCSFTCDGRYLGLCVSDAFGRLDTKTVREYLRKCFAGGPSQVDTKLRGGGLRLYYAFQSLNHLIINIAPGHRTEIIGLLDISGTFRDYVRQPKSFNVFIANGEIA